MITSRSILFAALSVAAVFPNAVYAEDPEKADFVEQPLAILPFRERGTEVKGMGSQATDLLFAELATNPNLYLVDREDLDSALAEQEMNISGIVNPAEATQIGQLTGAKLIVTGSVFQVQNSLYVVAKIIGTETSRVAGASVKGSPTDSLDGLIGELAGQIVTTVRLNATRLIATPVGIKDRVKVMREKLGDAARPTVAVFVQERHIGQRAFDPAAQTELTMICRETGFPVIDPEHGNTKQAAILIQGEGLSEFATRRGGLISVKARLEVKAIDHRSGQVAAVDRQTCVAVDLTEQIASKKAFEAAAANIAERLLPKLVSEPPTAD